MPALGPRAGHWATYEAPWRPLAAAELASAITARGLSWAQALRPGGRATGQALSLTGTCWGWAAAPPWWLKVIRGHTPLVRWNLII